jgi:hypothetical protein
MVRSPHDMHWNGLKDIKLHSKETKEAREKGGHTLIVFLINFDRFHNMPPFKKVNGDRRLI